MQKVGGHEMLSPKTSSPESSADTIIRASTVFSPKILQDGSALIPMLCPNTPHIAHLPKLRCSISTWIFSSLLGFLSKFHFLWEELSYLMSGSFTFPPSFSYFSGGFERRMRQAHIRIFTSPSACKRNQISEPTYSLRCGNLLTVHNMPKLHLLNFFRNSRSREGTLTQRVSAQQWVEITVTKSKQGRQWQHGKLALI